MARPPLWQWSELCRALGLPETEGPDVTGLAIDSRKVEPGDLFVALPGDPGERFHASNRSQRDGHDYVAMAAERGASGALVHRDVAPALATLLVQDTLDGLWALGRARRQDLDADVVAITGSSGKTTVKALLSRALGAFATEGSLNNHIGVPLSLALTPRDVDVAVFEIGTSHPGEIEPLAKLVAPGVAVVINVHPAHAEHFRSLDEIRKEKLSIINGLQDKRYLILEDLINSSELSDDLNIRTFGEGSPSFCQLVSVADETAEYRIDGEVLIARVPGGGRHRARSLAAVLAVMRVLDRDLQPALNLPDDLVPRGRGNVTEVHGISVVDDSYNANPASMAAALGGLVNPGGRTIAVLGEMLELGDEADAYHSGLAAACSHIDRVIAIGEQMRVLFDALEPDQRWLWQAEADEALLAELERALAPGDRVLIKGSNRIFWVSQFVQRLLERL